jgi:hypothetical protein
VSLRALPILVVVALLSGCDQLLDNNSRNDRMTKLEARVTALEGQSKQSHDDKAEQNGQMASCLVRANEAYWDHIKQNGHKKGRPDENGDETWVAPVNVWDQASKAKQNAIEECRILYARQ